MALSHIRHNIQVKDTGLNFVQTAPPLTPVGKQDKQIPFFSEDCCDWGGEDWEWPIRCSKHNKELKTWQRGKKSIDKWEKLFFKNYHKWRFVKMLTITTPPVLHWEIKIDRNKQSTMYPEVGHEHSYYVRHTKTGKYTSYKKSDYQVKLREVLKSRFKSMRKRSKFWNKYVEGGQWFFECPIDDNGIANPHLHVLLVGSKKIPVEELSEEFGKYKLGEVTYFSAPRNKHGVVQKMTYWRNRKLMLNKSAVRRALNYVSSYMKKEEQADGKNNSWFGSLYNK